MEAVIKGCNIFKGKSENHLQGAFLSDHRFVHTNLVVVREKIDGLKLSPTCLKISSSSRRRLSSSCRLPLSSASRMRLCRSASMANAWMRRSPCRIRKHYINKPFKALRHFQGKLIKSITLSKVIMILYSVFGTFHIKLLPYCPLPDYKEILPV